MKSRQLDWVLFRGGVAKWLGRGLQNRSRRFNSGRHLQIPLLFSDSPYSISDNIKRFKKGKIAVTFK